MSDLRTAAQQALEALENAEDQLAKPYSTDASKAITALRAALAQPVQEPVAYIHRQGNHWEVSERELVDDEKARGWTEEPLYTAPPQRLPLPKHDQHCVDVPGYGLMAARLVRAIERAHGIGVKE